MRHHRGFVRKVDATNWLNKQVGDQVTGSWTDPAMSGVTFGLVAERWLSTKATRAAETFTGYREGVALREVSFDDLQVWISAVGGRIIAV